MEREKIEIGYVVTKNFDFGLLDKESRSGIIKVDFDFWREYVDLRQNFGMIHGLLIDKIGRTKANNLLSQNE